MKHITNRHYEILVNLTKRNKPNLDAWFKWNIENEVYACQCNICDEIFIGPDTNPKFTSIDIEKITNHGITHLKERNLLSFI